jgi:hypothetical protein
MSMHTKMTMGQAHARRRSQSEEIRFIICFGRQSNKPPRGLADSGLHQNARQDSGSIHVVCRFACRQDTPEPLRPDDGRPGPVHRDELGRCGPFHPAAVTLSALSVGAVASWADGAHSAALTYEQIACDPWVWWRWLTPVVGVLSRAFSAATSSTPRRGGSRGRLGPEQAAWSAVGP